MLENQASIAAWADTSFGTSSPLRLANRANQEMSELLTVYTAPARTSEEIAEEAADVAIVLTRLELLLDDEEPQWDALVTSGEQQLSVETILADAVKGMARIIEALLHQDRDTAALALEGVLSDLADLVAWVGHDLPSAIDRKMFINRRRIWKPDATGHGYHTHQEVPAVQVQMHLSDVDREALSDALEQAQRSGAVAVCP